MEIKESGENYLETILLLENKNGHVRSIDIANEMNFSKPSISRAMSILKKAGLITVEQGGNIVLTQTGRKKANEIYGRHKLITQYLMITLGIDEDTAVQDACRIEHVISQKTIEKIKELLEKQRIESEEESKTVRR
ncbi:metal-dependent transcriptional regulator [Geosporobacter ferrireducens]|uniref:DtxR family transcriptional regulator n=1 Tax=Geosporobacter ferrireducens TaxID=1424294 RepID=A0A1D8GG36_9FIRM|nr:metal-dependent transcriptional regulator [Geosporobacter ferrireducens]AOT69845.1 DtxR family transcriptional regulator [Geosporobacter ferrireducens]MTI54460.1 metal-dependent transcriptional regulator [Geosporobacter ferrireducens]